MAATLASQDSERRRFPRHKCSGSVELFRQGNRCGWGRVNEISECGCYVEIFQFLPIDTEVQLKLLLGNEQLELNGRVALHDPGMGMGLEFVSLTDEQQAVLAQMASTLAAAQQPERPPELLVAPPHSAIARPTDYLSWQEAQQIITRAFKQLSERGSLTRQELVDIVNSTGQANSARA
jgi:hypothetical protein